jgi:hypothetical protein
VYTVSKGDMMSKVPKIVGFNPNKKKDVISEDSIDLPEDTVFEPNAKAFVSVKNNETKLYEMVVVAVDTVSGLAEIVSVTPTRYDSNARALHDTVTQVSNYYIKGENK